jgi:hypothetical protein
VNFNSHADVVVGVAVGLVNLLTEGEDRSRKYLPPDGAERAAKLSALFRSAGGRREVSAAEGEGFGAVAAELRAVFEEVAAGDTDSAARRVNAMLVVTGARPALDRHDGEPWHLHFHAADETSMVKSRAWRRVLRPARRVHGAALRPGLRGCLAQRQQAILLDGMPEPGEGGGVPRATRLSLGARADCLHANDHWRGRSAARSWCRVQPRSAGSSGLVSVAKISAARR